MKDLGKRAAIEADLVGPPFPPAGEYLFRWFLELNGARGAGAFGSAPLTYPDIDAWARLTGRRPSPWEVGTLKALDLAYLRATAPPARPGSAGSGRGKARG